MENGVEGWKKKEAYRLAAIAEFAAGITEETADHWFRLLVLCANVDVSVGSPLLGRFLELVGEVKPNIAESWLANREAKPPTLIVPPLLLGLEKVRPERADIFLASLVSDGSASVALLYLSTAKNLNTGLLQQAISVAMESNDWLAIRAALDTIATRATEIGPIARDLFLQVLGHLDANPQQHATLTISTFWKDHGLFDLLSDDDLRKVVVALVKVPNLDWHAESILVDVSDRIPHDVVALFGARFAYEPSLSDRDARREYEPVPHKLDRLANALSSHTDQILEQTAQWSVSDPLRRYRGASFAAQMMGPWTPVVESVLWSRFENGGDEEKAFVLDVLRNFEGDDVVHDLLRDIVAALPQDSELLSEASAVLHESGIMYGEFGFANDYKAKREALSGWVNDDRERVRTFAEGILHEFQNAIAVERRRAEESLALRRLEYDEPPVSKEDDNAA